MRASYDEGKTWKRKTVIHAGPAAYSDLVKLDDEHVGVLFEAGRRLYDEVLFAKVGLKDLSETVNELTAAKPASGLLQHLLNARGQPVTGLDGAPFGILSSASIL